MNEERYTLEWRGTQKGPWTLSEIEQRLDDGDIHSLHKIQVDGRWVVLRGFLEEQQLARKKIAAAEKTAAPAMAAYVAPPPPPVYYPVQEAQFPVQESRYPNKEKSSLGLVPVLILAGVGIAVIAIIAGYLLANLGRHDSKTELLTENKSEPKVEIKASAQAATQVELPTETKAEPKPKQEPKPALVPEPDGTVSVVAPKAANASSSELTTEQLTENKSPFVVPLNIVWTIRDKSGKLQKDGSSGSGVYLNDEGAYSIFITNRHVVEVPSEAEKAAGSMLFRGEDVPFEVIAFGSNQLDLAKIRIKKSGAAIPPMEVAKLAELKQGQECVAIGNALGAGISITTGVISAIDEWEAGKYIRTSAAISSGNSGGGLFRKKDGKLIGITTKAILGESDSVAQNFNQAIPIDYVFSDLFWEKHSK